jgi:hypothetical protein
MLEMQDIILMALRRLVMMLIPVLMVSLFVPNGFISHAQDTTTQTTQIENLVELNVTPAYDSFFRAENWIPLRIQARNNSGSNINGRLIVRPETSGNMLRNAYSTPLDLPDGSDKVAFLYIQARDADGDIIVELLNNDNVRVQQQPARLIHVEPDEKLHMVISSTGASSIPLNNVAPAGRTAHQARWTPDNIPAEAPALYALDTLILHDVDSSTLTTAQTEAIQQYVQMGGHLVVTGGAAWRTTAAAFANILPLIPDDSRTLDGLPQLAQFIGTGANTLDTQAVIATGTLQDEAQVLVQADDETPLVVRGESGAGTVDYLAFDPTQQPFSGWSDSITFWVHLLETPDPQPGWQRGFLVAQDAARALAVLPNVELLPPVTSMMAYIVIYVLLIGPVNYFVLSRLNRREWAWVTIPALIGGFTLLAWTVGFNLRGQEVIVSRLSVVQSWTDSDEARVDGLLGVLAPRRDTYELRVSSGEMLNTMPELTSDGFLRRNLTQSSAEIVQTDSYSAENVTIDGGIFANFSTTGRTQKPELGGSLTFSYDNSAEQLQGAVRNDDDFTLTDAVVLTRNAVYFLEEDLAPGDVVTFDTDDMTIYREGEERVASASPLESYHDFVLPNTFRTRTQIFNSLQSARLILGDLTEFSGRVQEYDNETQIRRQAFLGSFMRDQFNSPGMGHDAYLIGWGPVQATDITLADSTPRFVDSGLYIVALETEVTAPAGERASITADMQTWTILNSDQSEGRLNNLVLLNGGAANIRFMPLDSSRLSTVESLTVEMSRSSSYGRNLVISLWDWENNTWENLPDNMNEIYNLEDVAAFIGPDNMMDVRVSLNIDVGSVRVSGIRITQHGEF